MTPTQPENQYNFHSRFPWVGLYEELSEKLLNYRSKEKREELCEWIHEQAENKVAGFVNKAEGRSLFIDQFKNDEPGPFEDIDPFTVFSIFNRSKQDVDERKDLLAKFWAKLGVPTPDNGDSHTMLTGFEFDGIPTSNPTSFWFFAYEKDRQPDDIDKLWSTFAAASKLSQHDTDGNRTEFCRAFDDALLVKQTALKLLSMGLFWTYPRFFPTLDENSRSYILKYTKDKLFVKYLGAKSWDKKMTGAKYLEIRDALLAEIENVSFIARSLPEISLKAWENRNGNYTVEDIRKEGCFLEEDELKQLLKTWCKKKNLILQGPPGTGKTWLAKRLAYALIGSKLPEHVNSIQFHPNLSYEDFVRGWRPTKQGKLEIVEGLFMQTLTAARKSPEDKFVIIIEEINRGNPAHIFGEMLTLIEADKRYEEEALKLSYPDQYGKYDPVYVSGNLYIIGTMNTADRSLALIDFALRRRFGFFTLDPQLNHSWKEWVTKKCNMPEHLADKIAIKMTEVNESIAGDLGKQFKIGHSYVTPTNSFSQGELEANDWFVQVLETEIAPLLEEYWFDEPDKVEEALKILRSALTSSS